MDVSVYADFYWRNLGYAVQFALNSQSGIDIDSSSNNSLKHRQRIHEMDRILSLTPVLTIVLDPDHTVLQASRGFYDVTGLATCECINCNFSKLLDIRSVQDDIALAVSKREAVVCKEPYGVNERHWRIRICSIFEGTGELLYIVIEFDDVTEEVFKLNSLAGSNTGM